MHQFSGLIIGGFNQRGFTLVEVLIALVVATIGLLSLSMMQVHAIKGNGVASRYTQATFLAQDMLERIKDGNCVGDGAFGFIDMSDIDPGVAIDSGGSIGINERGEIGGPFTIQWQVLTNTDWSRRVDVNVGWEGNSGVKRHVALSSVTRGGGN